MARSRPAALGAAPSTEESRDAAAPPPGLRDRESNANPIGGAAGRKALDHESGLDEVLHHRWCQYLCALVVWAYGHALTIPRNGTTAADAACRSRDVPGASSTAPSTRPGSAHRNGNSTFGASVCTLSRCLSRPSVGRAHSYGRRFGPTARRQRDRQAEPRRSRRRRPSTFSEAHVNSKTADDHCVCGFASAIHAPFLEMVEREVRASRWELGREASGVLRKLISNHSLGQSGDRSKNADATAGTGQLDPRRNGLFRL
ncbi:hypothetical protein L1887_54393 [Cichorium endivia]|nr:hypothetical protein L1887_54393 [Cichorium endivia]